MPSMVGPAVGAKQPLDATLTALAGLNSSAGLVEQTGSNAFTKRSIGVFAGTSIPTRADADTRFAAIVHTHSESDITGLVTDLASKVATTRTINTTAPITGGGNLTTDRTIAISDFAASGVGHARGSVPDTPALSGASKFLREDATWSSLPSGLVVTSANIDVTTPSYEFTGTITDAACTAIPPSKIVISDGVYSDADANVADVDYYIYSISAGSFTVKLVSRSNAPFFGIYKFVYILG